MKLGLMSAAFPKMSLDELAKWTAGNGFEMLELACWPVGKADRRYAGVTHVDVANLTAVKNHRMTDRASFSDLHGYSLVDMKHGKVLNVGFFPDLYWCHISPYYCVQPDTAVFSNFYISCHLTAISQVYTLIYLRHGTAPSLSFFYFSSILLYHNRSEYHNENDFLALLFHSVIINIWVYRMLSASL